MVKDYGVYRWGYKQMGKEPSGKQIVIRRFNNLIEVIDYYTDISPFNRSVWKSELLGLRDNIKQNLQTVPIAQRKKNSRENLTILCGEIKYINVHPHKNDPKRLMIQSAIYPFDKTTGKPINLSVPINAYDDNAKRLKALHLPAFVKITGYLEPKTYVDKNKGRMYLTYIIVKEFEVIKNLGLPLNCI